MGLAPYGWPVYAENILKHLIDLKPDGSFRLDTKYFNFCQGLTMTGRRFHKLFGGPPRRPESDLTQRHMDLAASIQVVTEEILIRGARHVHRETGMKHLVMAGGVALNCVANGRLLREGPFDGIWVQPASGDAGGALGSAMFVWHQLLDKPRHCTGTDSQKGSLLGPSFAPAEVRQFLNTVEAPFHEFPDERGLLDHTAKLLNEGKIVGWFQGRMEFGPRALGARSILGDARSHQMQSAMNLKIKFRESFRPFAPVVLAEDAHEWFDFRPGEESPYMLLVASVLHRHRIRLTDHQRTVMTEDPDLRHRVTVARSTIPAVTHVDYSARVQTVDAVRNQRLHRLLLAFKGLTGFPVLVNTSFNVRGEPIVCSPRDAYRCFMSTDMDALVLDDCVLHKSEMDPATTSADRQHYLAQFQLD
jgi:carbamoyltransferase